MCRVPTRSGSTAGSAVNHQYRLALGVAVDTVGNRMDVADLQHAFLIGLDGRIHGGVGELVSISLSRVTGSLRVLGGGSSGDRRGGDGSHGNKLARRALRLLLVAVAVEIAARGS